MSNRIQCGGLIERRNLCLIEVLGYAWVPGSSCGILGKFAAAQIPVGYLTISECADRNKQMVLCIDDANLEPCRPLLQAIRAESSPAALRVTPNVVILTVYGPHFYERAALASEVYSALCVSAIDAHSVGSSINSISLVVDAADRDRALESLRSRFSWPE
jgi:aspartokinase